MTYKGNKLTDLELKLINENETLAGKLKEKETLINDILNRIDRNTGDILAELKKINKTF